MRPSIAAAVGVVPALIAGCYLSHERGDSTGECVAPACELRFASVEVDTARLEPGRYRARLVDINDTWPVDTYVSVVIGEVDGRPGVVFVVVRGIGVGIAHEIVYRGPIELSLREDAIIVNRVVCEDCSDPLRLLFVAVEGELLEGFDAPLTGVRVERGETVCAINSVTGDSTRRALRVTDLSSGESHDIDVGGPPTDFGDPPLRFQLLGSGTSCGSPGVPPPTGFETMTWIAWSLAR